MKKLVSLVMAIAMMLCLVASAETAGIPADQIKVGAIILHDQMSGKEYLGCIIMLTAVVLAQLPEPKKKSVC